MGDITTIVVAAAVALSGAAIFSALEIRVALARRKMKRAEDEAWAESVARSRVEQEGKLRRVQAITGRATVHGTLDLTVEEFFYLTTTRATDDSTTSLFNMVEGSFEVLINGNPYQRPLTHE